MLLSPIHTLPYSKASMKHLVVGFVGPRMVTLLRRFFKSLPGLCVQIIEVHGVISCHVHVRSRGFVHLVVRNGTFTDRHAVLAYLHNCFIPNGLIKSAAALRSPWWLFLCTSYPGTRAAVPANLSSRQLMNFKHFYKLGDHFSKAEWEITCYCSFSCRSVPEYS